MVNYEYPTVRMVLEFHDGVVRQYEDIVWHDDCYVEYDQHFIKFCTKSTSIMYPTPEIKSVRYYAPE